MLRKAFDKVWHEGLFHRIFQYDIRGNVYENWVVYHLPNNSGNSSWKINGTHCFGILQWNFRKKWKI